MTAEELLALPDSGMRYELIDGDLIQMPPAAYDYGIVADNLKYYLDAHIRRHRLGRTTAAGTGFALTFNTVLVPDGGFVSAQRDAQAREQAPLGQNPKYFPGAPDLAFKILSPLNATHEIARIIRLFRQYGTQLTWIVDPSMRRVTVYRQDGTQQVLTEADKLSGESLLPGVEVEVSSIFA